jgi:hypothetical protein
MQRYSFLSLEVAVKAGLVVLALCAPLPAFAQDDRSTSSGANAEADTVAAQRSADAGGFTAWTQPARNGTQRVLVRVVGGYDQRKGQGTFDSSVQGTLTDRISLRAAGTTAASSARLNLRFEGKVDALRQGSHGVDLALGAGYETYGFNNVSALVGRLAVGRSLGRVQLLANVGYARGLEREEEHYASASAAGLVRVTDSVQVGVDSQFSADLERDDDEPPGEREWEAQVGPLVTVTAGPLAVSGGAGVTVNRLRLEPGTNVGALAYVGVGAAF